MQSASNGGVLKGRLQVLHVHVLLIAPLGTSHMAQPGTDQHEGGVAVREAAYHAGTAAAKGRSNSSKKLSCLFKSNICNSISTSFLKKPSSIPTHSTAFKRISLFYLFPSGFFYLPPDDISLNQNHLQSDRYSSFV